MTPRIFVISLPGSTERQAAIAAQLERHHLAFSWLEGVNGRALDEAEIERVYSRKRAQSEGGRQLSRGEIGCALSHLKIYQQMTAENIGLALVLEDDAALSADFAHELTQVCEAVDWQTHDVALLSHIHKYTLWGACQISGKLRLVRPIRAYNGNGYLLTQRGARKLLAELRPVYQPADSWNALQKKKALSIRGVVPYLVNHSRLSADSLIGDALRSSKRPASHRSPCKWFKRIFYDKFIYQILVKPILRIRKQPESW